MEQALARNWDRTRGLGLPARLGFVGRVVLDWAVSVPREWLDLFSGMREVGMVDAWGALWQDVRYGVKGMIRRPAATSTLIVTLGFGIGGVAAVDSVLRGTLFRTLPYDRPEQIHLFSDDGSWAARDLAAIEDGSEVLSAVAAYHAAEVVMQFGTGGVTAEDGLVVSRDFFDVFGAGLHLGGGFRPGDFAPQAAGKAVLSYSTWRELGADPSLVGGFLTLDGAEVEVVGVTPPGFYYPTPGTRIYRPMQLDRSGQDRFLTLAARVTEGVHPGRIATEALRIDALVGRSDEDGAQPVTLTPIRTAVFGQGSTTMLLAAGAVGLVLLMALVNVATLLLARIHERARELSLRQAIGASRGRLARQLMTESSLLGVVGAGASLLTGAVAHRLLLSSLPIASGDALALELGPRFVLVCLMLGLLVGALVGWATACVVPAPMARGTRGSSGSRRATTVHNAMVVCQVALSVAMVGGSALMIRSVGALSQIETGLAPGSAIVADIVVAATEAPEARAQLYRELVDDVTSMPETDAAGLTQKLPLRGPGWTSGVRDLVMAEDPAFVSIRFVSPGYFTALGIPLVSGRLPDGSIDTAEGEAVSWVNTALAQQLWSGSDGAEDRQLQVWGSARRVSGVVGNVAESGLRDDQPPAVYLPLEQTPRFAGFTLVARPRSDATEGYASRLERLLAERHPQLAVKSMVPFGAVVDSAQGDTLTMMRLLIIVAVLALIVGAVGVHGVMAHWVRERVAGWAVALALGATPRGILLVVMTRSLTLTGSGIVLGLILFAVGSTALESVLYGVGRLDAQALVLTAVIMVTTGLVGAVVPAIRAGRTDPVSLLKAS